MRVTRPKRSVGVGRSISDSHALRTSELATHRQKLISIEQVEKVEPQALAALVSVTIT